MLRQEGVTTSGTLQMHFGAAQAGIKEAGFGANTVFTARIRCGEIKEPIAIRHGATAICVPEMLLPKAPRVLILNPVSSYSSQKSQELLSSSNRF